MLSDRIIISPSTYGVMVPIFLQLTQSSGDPPLIIISLVRAQFVQVPYCISVVTVDILSPFVVVALLFMGTTISTPPRNVKRGVC